VYPILYAFCYLAFSALYRCEVRWVLPVQGRPQSLVEFFLFTPHPQRESQEFFARIAQIGGEELRVHYDRVMFAKWQN
jgi:hypothetical protein